MKIVEPKSIIAFSFRKYCTLILEILPRTDLVGIEHIKFVESFSDWTLHKRAVACHSNLNRRQRGTIEIHFGNLLIKNLIPMYLFKSHQEIAALLLSEILCHEVGHHAHKFKRSGVSKDRGEYFADSYAAAGYFNYFQSRKKEILETFDRASGNHYLYDEPARESFKRCRLELEDFLERNKEGIKFP